MATYAIGDVQGCYDELCSLLELIRFDPAGDRLWFAGDLVNRGPDSLSVLRLVKGLGDRAVTVLGNHDLHLLATAAEVRFNVTDTIADVLSAGDREDLLGWLRGCPLFHRDSTLGYCMVHAGLAPPWTLDDAETLARELEASLSGADYRAFLNVMYGNRPDKWGDALKGHDRLRFITNAFTRIRYCREDGSLALEETRAPGTHPPGCYPWFAHPERRNRGGRIVFGHWAALRMTPEEESAHGVYHIDQGCVWGGELTAMRLDDGERFSVPSRQPRRY
ncbi:MAG: symmetrical bis(5'-nucleosyl)-tetraphosphatase [Gammaproteobacteria bacterium]|nr:symmetrical bis(5'-nucleosyl)-tetraphosphatase [Gammaproteobacteria bacterium]